MLLRDTFSKLSSHLVIEYFRDQPAERFAEKYNIIAPMATLFSENKVKSFYYLPAQVENDRDKMIFLQQYNARKNQGIWTIYFNSDFYPDLSFLRRINELPSVVIDDMHLVNGHHYFHARFSELFMQEVSSTVVNLVAENDTFQIVNYGSNMGIDYLMNYLPCECTRSMREARLIIEDYSEDNYGGFEIPDGTVREFKSYSDVECKSGIYYFPEGANIEPPSDFRKISDSESYYEGPIKSEILDFLSYYSTGIPLLSISRVQKFSDGKLTLEYMLNDWTLEILVRRLKEAREKFPELNIYLDYASEILPEISAF